MNPQLSSHLDSIEIAIRGAKERLSRHGFPRDKRTLILVGIIDQTLEHNDSFILLTRAGKIGSAFALARCIFENLFRGLWLNFCASESEVGSFEKDDRLPLNMTELASAIDTKYKASGTFETIRVQGWSHLCSFSHTGMLQIGRRFNEEEELQPAYTDPEVSEVATGAAACALSLVGRFLVVQGHSDDGRAVEALISDLKT